MRVYIPKNSSSCTLKVIAPYTHDGVFNLNKKLSLKKFSGASLVAQWLRIFLPMQGTRVQALVREDPTCHGATEAVHHNY